ncbi:MAG: dethiobiotin synthase [Deltaproteobacteria bacterium]|jgi:dethiobiotin synthetase
MTRGLFLTATGTDCGKTWLGRGLARSLASRGLRVAALKPLETDVRELARDATALARAAGDPALATHGVRYRAPLSPWAAARAEGRTVPSPAHLAADAHQRARGYDVVLVEGAGGLLVPLDETSSVADLAGELGFPLVLVGRDALGTLSHVLTAWESAERRRLPVRAVVLTRGPWSEGDPSTETNASFLGGRLPVPVLVYAASRDDDDALAAAASPLVPTLFPGLDEASRP